MLTDECGVYRPISGILGSYINTDLHVKHATYSTSGGIPAKYSTTSKNVYNESMSVVKLVNNIEWTDTVDEYTKNELRRARKNEYVKVNNKNG